MKEPRIVIIDNDLEDIEILESIIKSVDSAAKCLSLIFSDEALRLLTEELSSPDFIFIDVNMNRVTGPECLRRLCGDPKFENTKIVMLSGVMPRAVGESFIRLGAFTYFQKPLVDSVYRETIAWILQTKAEEAAQELG